MSSSLTSKLTPQLNWVIIDPNIDTPQVLVDGVTEDSYVLVLDAHRDGIKQITELLQSAAIPPQSLHLISHGAPGTLYLGNTELSLSTLQDYAQFLGTWAIEHLLIYGCHVAAGDAGEEFLAKLNALTGASIAASTTLVGSPAHGGNWVLDATTHAQAIELALKPTAIADYKGVLATLPDVADIFNFNGVATRTDVDEIFLVPDANDQSGSAFSRARIDFRRNWEFTFEIFLGDDDAGADGIGFVLHNDPAGSEAIGLFGEGLGVAGVENAVAIEFDTFRNIGRGDPVADHTAFILDPENNLNHDSPENAFTLLPDIEDNAFHLVVVNWDATTDTLSYTFDGELLGSIDRDVIDLDFGGSDLIYWGFGAATGDETNEHHVRLIGFNGRLVDESGTAIIDTTSSGEVLSSPSVFQFAQFVEFEAIDERRPYQGNQAIFHEEIYLAHNSDVQAAVSQGVFSSGLEHFTMFGADEGRSLLPLDFEVGGLQMSSLFDETFYLNHNPDVAAAVASGGFTYGYDHFLKHGITEGRNPSYYYDEALYLNTYADVRAAVESGVFSSGLEHYLNFGHIENRTASELFDPHDYLLNNADVAAAVNSGGFVSGFEHYLEFGAAEGRIATLLYEEAFYLKENPDVAAAVSDGIFETGFEHYVIFGQREGRDSGPLFDESIYLDQNPDVAAAVSGFGFSSGMEHFFRHGRGEGRLAVHSV